MKRQHRISAIVSTILMAVSFFSQSAAAQQGSTAQQTQPGQSSAGQPATAPAGTTPANDQTAAPADTDQQQQQTPSPAPASGTSSSGTSSSGTSSSGTTVNPSQGPLQPVTTYPDASGAQQQDQPATANPQTTTAPDAPQPKKQPAEPVGAAAAESVPTAGGAAAKPAGVAIAPAKQHQTRSLLLKIGAIAAAGAALGAVFALSHSTPSTPPGAATPGSHLTLARHFLYLLDAVNLCRVVARARRSGADVVILDRYIYDELSNLNAGNPLSRAFVRWVHGFVPRPNIAYLLDADPVAAYARKPEYPVEFMEKCRRAYFDLAAILKTMTVIPALSLPEARLAVLTAAERALAAQGRTADLVSGKLSAA